MNNYIGLKGFSSTLSPLPEHLQMRVMEEHGIANMMKQPACNRATDAIYAITSPVNGWRSGQSAEIWNQRLNLILMVLDCHQKDIKPVNKLFEYLLLICLFIILILEILVTDRYIWVLVCLMVFIFLSFIILLQLVIYESYLAFGFFNSEDNNSHTVFPKCKW